MRNGPKRNESILIGKPSDRQLGRGGHMSVAFTQSKAEGLFACQRSSWRVLSIGSTTAPFDSPAFSEGTHNLSNILMVLNGSHKECLKIIEKFSSIIN